MPVFITMDPKSRKFTENLKFEEVKHKNNILIGLNVHGQYVCEKLQNKIESGERHGRVYSYKGTKYTASAPGEPPANRSGKLAKSFGHTQTTKELVIFNTAFSDTGYPYPWGLERGTSKMPDPRPYFVSTILENAVELKKELKKKKE